MRQYLVLLKKELQELLTPLIIVPLLITVVLFFGLGKLGSSEMAKAKSPTPIMVIDEDQSATSQQLITALGQQNFSLIPPTANPLTDTEAAKGVAYLVMPSGFGAGLTSGQPQTIAVHSVLTQLSLTSQQRQAQVAQAVNVLSAAVSQQLIGSQTKLDPAFALKPISSDDYVAVGDREAHVSFAAIANYVQSQTYFVPIIVFIVIIFASQMIATSIASEKENKTLETLLSVPVSRQSIVLAKLSAAALMALGFSTVYMFSMKSYVSGITGGSSPTTTPAVKEALTSLGLHFGTTQYLLLGLTLFFAIAVGLAIALILGAFAEDVKSIQSVITPLMVLVMIPYFLVMFTDTSQLAPLAKYALYLIPFSHPFLAVNFLMQQQYAPVVWGVLYQMFVFAIFVYIGAKIFSSDRILTLKLNFSKKR